ncbi:MAG: hypothetical protein LEGION0403_FIIPPAGN_02184 [Legionella sp.]
MQKYLVFLTPLVVNNLSIYKNLTNPPYFYNNINKYTHLSMLSFANRRKMGLVMIKIGQFNKLKMVQEAPFIVDYKILN